MVKLFISYRRDDSSGETNRLAGVLKRHFGGANVILDTDNFLVGNDFRSEIMRHLKEADVVLVIMGKSWYSILSDRLAGSSGTEPDWVMREIEEAIKHHKRIIPVLLNNNFMPSAKRLPSSIQELTYKNGMKLRTSIYHFGEDSQHLIQKIEESIGIFVEPEPNTREYLFYLLRNSSWSIRPSQDGNEVYLCDQNSAYQIVVDLQSEEYEDNYTSEWADNFVGPHRVYPVFVKLNGQVIEKTYFVSVWGAKYFVPLPSIDGAIKNPIYYWDTHSIGMKLARHVARFHTKYKTPEEFAAFANIELRE